MQNLTKFITEAKKKGVSEEGVLNIIREYLQVLIVKAIYQSKYGSNMSFMGGTCLRICHNLKRYSEDLDFALEKKVPRYSFQALNDTIAAFLKNTDFEVDVHVKEDKVVQKSFIRVSKVLFVFGLSPLKSQKLHVKLEIDTRPVPISPKERETFFVAKFQEMFPIIKHTDETLFAGKICAVLNREYTKGRDFYDLLWYLNEKKDINLGYLKRAMKQAGIKKKWNKRIVFDALKKRVKTVDVQVILKDISVFLEDPAEKEVLKQYPVAFVQALSRYERAMS